jgi:uncharacterized protein DUF3489
MSKSAKNPTKLRLSDTQLIALSSAAQREDGAITTSDRLKGVAAQKFIVTLIHKGLAREMRAKPGTPIARRDDEGRAYALVITKAGRAAVLVDENESGGAASENTPKRKAAEKARPAKQSPAPPMTKAAGGSAGSSAEQSDSSSPSVDNHPREGSKLASVIGLLARPDGAGLDELIAATEWLPHTARAALTGLRKRGYAIERRRVDGKTRYGTVTPKAADAA